MTVRLEPLRDLIVVRLRPLPDHVGAILMPLRQESAREADVVAVGPEVRDVLMGQGVLVSALAGQIVGDDILLPESAVLAYLDD